MQQNQRYSLTIYELFTISGGTMCGAEAEVTFLDAGIDRVELSGKCQSKHGYPRVYAGKSKLTAKLVSGPGRIQFVTESLPVTSAV